MKAKGLKYHANTPMAAPVQQFSRRLFVYGTLACLAILSFTAHAAADSLAMVSPERSSQAAWLQHVLTSHAPWVAFVVVFFGGLALNLTPCVYPMIPVTLAFFGGQASGRVGYTARLGVWYVVGISLMYAMLGLVAAKTGSLFGSWLQRPWVLLLIAALVAALALSMFGFYELRPPRWFAERFGQAQTGQVGALVMGLTVGLIAAPCIGPVIVGLLFYVSQLSRPWFGFWLLFAMGIGMGVPYLFLGIFANRISHWPKSGVWLVWTKKILGVALFGLCLYFLRPLLAPGLFRVLMGIGLVSAGLYLGWLERTPLSGILVWVRRALGIGLIAASITVLWPARQGGAGTGSGVVWQPFSSARLADAQQQHRPAIVDVYADWCVPCVELDHVTFSDPEVIHALSEVVTLRVDATRDISAEAQALLDRYDVAGVPTVLIFDRHGQERSDARVEGFLPPKEFLTRLSRLHEPQETSASH